MRVDSTGLEQRLAHENGEVRRRAVLDAADLNYSKGVELIEKALADEDWRVRKEATTAAARMHERGAPGLIAKLIDGITQEEAVGKRNAALEALVLIGADVCNALIVAMSTFDAGGRKMACEALGAIDDPRAIDELIERLQDPDGNVRACAAEWLGEKTDKRAVAALQRCLENSDRLVALCALQSLNRMEVSLPLLTLTPLLSQKGFKSELLLSLGRCGEPAAASIIAEDLAKDFAAAKALVLLHGASEKTAQSVEAVMADMDDSEVEFLIQHTTSAEPEEQRVAVNCLLFSRRLDLMDTLAKLSASDSLHQLVIEGLKHWGTSAQDRLEEMLNETKGKKRASIVSLLAKLLSLESGRSRIDIFAELLKSDDMAVVTAAAGGVARFGNQSAIPRLIELAESPYERVRRAAGQALVELGRRYPDGVRESLKKVEFCGLRGIELCRVLEVVGTVDDSMLLSVMLASPTPEQRAAAVRTLAGLAGEGALNKIALAMTDEDLQVRMAAASSLGKLGPAASETVVSALSPAEGPLKSALIKTLGQVGHPDARRILRSVCHESADIALAALEAMKALDFDAGEIQDVMLQHKDNEVIKQALSVLGDKIDYSMLKKLLENPLWDVRLAAVERIKNNLSNETAALLEEQLRRESDDLVKRAIESALERNEAR